MTETLQASEQRTLILSVFEEFAEDADELFAFLDHAGVDLRVLRSHADLPDVIVAHYRIKHGEYDVERALTDLLTWPPVARRCFELLSQELEEKQNDL